MVESAEVPLRLMAIGAMAAPSTVPFILKMAVARAAGALLGGRRSEVVTRAGRYPAGSPGRRLVARIGPIAHDLADCTKRPAIYMLALRWLLYQFAFTGAGSLALGEPTVSAIGWLVGIVATAETVIIYLVHRSRTRPEAVADPDGDPDGTAPSPARRPVILILVVTKEERDAVFEVARRYGARPRDDDLSGRLAVHRLGTVGGADILLAQAGEAGTASAASMLFCAREVIVQVRPDSVLLVGICFGLREDDGQRIGDVVVARRIHNIDPVRLGENGPVARGVVVGCSPLLLDRCIAAEAAWPGPTVHFGTVLTSNALVDSSGIVHRLRGQFPDGIAGEMEAAGVYEAATYDPKPDWIMVKAISDFGHDRADGVYPVTAARNAAEFVMHVITRGGLPVRS